MAGIQCKVDIPKVQGLEESQLTVGREFYLICEGDWPKTLKTDSLSFVGDENTKYQIRLLNFEFRSPTEADLKVTSYLAGPQKFANLILTDGEQKVELGQVEYQLQSVLKKDEKVEPFGPMGPATIPIPIFYWLVLVAVLAAFGFFVGLRFWRHNQRRNMLEKLKQHESALTPLQEFHQSMRKLQRGNPVFYGKEPSPEELAQGIADLSHMFNMYISRRLSVPAFDWNERLILKDIQRYHPAVYADQSRKILDLFSEFKKAKDAKEKLNSKDVLQLSESVRKALEGIERSFSQTGDAAKRGRR